MEGVGCLFIYFKAKLSIGADDFEQICVDVGTDQPAPLLNVVAKFIGPNNTILVGKPKILFFVDCSSEHDVEGFSQVINTCFFCIGIVQYNNDFRKQFTRGMERATADS